MIKAVVISMIVALVGWPMPPQGFEKKFSVQSGSKLEVDLKTGGSLTISGWDKDEVLMTGRIGGRDADDCEVDATQSGGTVRLTAAYRGHRNSRTSHLEFTIHVPRRFNLDLETMGGAISLESLEGKMEGRTMGGALMLRKLAGTLRLTTMGGDITLSDSDVDGTVGSMGGDVLLDNVSGEVKATTQGGKVTQKNVRNSSSRNAKGEVTIRTMGGDINVDDAPEGTDVNTMGGDIHIRNAAHHARAKTLGGDITIDDIDGSIIATTLGGNVDVTMTGDPANGDRSADISSLGGDITLVVPAKLSMDILIELTYLNEDRGTYKISSDFPLQQEESHSSVDDKGSERNVIRGTGTINGGKNRIRIKTLNGNVHLRKG
jgi:DUF4097 and DUF4098 domain-containing protein YvlB